MERNPAKQNQGLLITAVALGILLNPLNTTMISVAFSRLQQEFHLGFSGISWLIATYYLASAIAQPVMGKLSDLYGSKRVFLAGLALVTVSSALAPLSPSFGWLLAFRVIQAIGTSSIYPAGMGIIRHAITENQARALGILSVFSSTSTAFGPSIGGVLIFYGDWPAIFLINFPVILVSFLLAMKVMPQDSARSDANTRLDWPGVAFFSILISSWLLFFLSFEHGVYWWALAAAVPLTFLFYRFENGREQPFVDVKFLRNNRGVSLVYLQFIFVNIVFYSVMFAIPMYLQNVRHYDALQTGFLMLSIAGSGVLFTPFAARWIDRSGAKPALLAGMAIMLAGTLLLLSITDAVGAVWMFIAFGVLGASNGFNNLGLQTALYNRVVPAQTGIASGLFMTSRYIGSILSSSLLGTLFAGGMSIAKLHAMAIVCAVISGLMLAMTYRIPGNRPAVPQYSE